MNREVDELCKCAAAFFNIEERDFYNRKWNNQSVTAKYIVWYVLHDKKGYSSRNLAELFFRNKRSIFYGISKVRYWLGHQRGFAKMYDCFINEYERS